MKKILLKASPDIAPSTIGFVLENRMFLVLFKKKYRCKSIAAFDSKGLALFRKNDFLKYLLGEN